MCGKNRLILHVGLHKTGTSAIQKFLGKNIKNFQKIGVFVPFEPDYVPGEKNIHHYIPSLFKTYELNEIFNIFNKIVNDARLYDQVVISSEVFNELSADLKIIQKVLSLFFNDIKVIIYIRRQDELSYSAYNQRVKRSNRTIKFNFEFLPFSLYLDYYVLLNKYSNLFGKDNIKVRVYNKSIHHSNNLIHDFFQSFNLTIPEGFNMLENGELVNPSLGVKALEFCRMLNYFVVGKTKRRFVECLFNLPNEFESDSIYLTPTDRNRILNLYSNSNKLVAKHYFNSEDEIFKMENFDYNSNVNKFSVLDFLDESQVYYIFNFIKNKDPELIDILKFKVRETDPVIDQSSKDFVNILNKFY